MQSTADSGRGDQARVLLATAGQWIKVRANDGRPLAHGVPSASRLGVVHLAQFDPLYVRRQPVGPLVP